MIQFVQYLNFLKLDKIHGNLSFASRDAHVTNFLRTA